MRKFQTRIACLFLALFAALGVLHLATPDQDFSTSERRPLAKAPALTLSSWFDGSFASQTGKWLADQFPARQSWLSLKAQTQEISGQADNDRVYFAADHSLIEIHENLDEAKLRRNIGDVVYFVEKFWPLSSERPASLVLAPTLSAVSPNLLPSLSQEAPQAVILAELLDQAEAGGLYAPDLLSAMQGQIAGGADSDSDSDSDSDTGVGADVGAEVPADAALYFRTDHHWTQDGARVAFSTWLSDRGLESSMEPSYQRELVSRDFRGTTAAKANLWTVPSDEIFAYRNEALTGVKLIDKNGTLIREGIYNEEALTTYDPYEFFVGENRDWLKLEMVDSGIDAAATGRHLLLFKDSYANAFVPFLCPYYDSITMVDLRYLNEGMEDLLARGDYSEVLFLYNIVTLADENSTFKLMR